MQLKVRHRNQYNIGNQLSYRVSFCHPQNKMDKIQRGDSSTFGQPRANQAVKTHVGVWLADFLFPTTKYQPEGRPLLETDPCAVIQTLHAVDMFISRALPTAIGSQQDWAHAFVCLLGAIVLSLSSCWHPLRTQSRTPVVYIYIYSEVNTCAYPNTYIYI